MYDIICYFKFPLKDNYNDDLIHVIRNYIDFSCITLYCRL